MIKLRIIYYSIVYGYSAILGACLTLLGTTLAGVTNCNIWVLMTGIMLPLIVGIGVYLGGFCWYFSIDLYKRYQTFKAIRLARQIDKDQKNIWTMIKKLKDS